MKSTNKAWKATEQLDELVGLDEIYSFQQPIIFQILDTSHLAKILLRSKVTAAS